MRQGSSAWNDVRATQEAGHGSLDALGVRSARAWLPGACLLDQSLVLGAHPSLEVQAKVRAVPRTRFEVGGVVRRVELPGKVRGCIVTRG